MAVGRSDDWLLIGPGETALGTWGRPQSWTLRPAP